MTIFFFFRKIGTIYSLSAKPVEHKRCFGEHNTVSVNDLFS